MVCAFECKFSRLNNVKEFWRFLAKIVYKSAKKGPKSAKTSKEIAKHGLEAAKIGYNWPKREVFD